MSREGDLVLNLTEAMVGAITPNVRMVSTEFRQPPRVRVHFLLEKESAGDRGGCDEIAFNLAALSQQAVEVEARVLVSSTLIGDIAISGRVVYGRKEAPFAEERKRTAPIVDTLSRWGVTTPVRLVERRPFENWAGRASSWGERLKDGRLVVVEVQDTWAEPWLEDAGPTVLDVGEESVCLTAKHALYSPELGDFRPAEAWLNGELRQTLSETGAPLTATAAGWLDQRPCRVVDLTVTDEPRTFVAAGIVVHNKSVDQPCETDEDCPEGFDCDPRGFCLPDSGTGGASGSGGAGGEGGA